MTKDFEQAINTENGAKFLENLFLSDRLYRDPDPEIDQFAEFVRDARADDPSRPWLSRTVELLITLLPKLTTSKHEVWFRVNELASIFGASASGLGRAIHAGMMAPEPCPRDPQARCYALEAVLATGRKLCASDIRKAGAAELFAASPAWMIEIATRLSDPNFQQIVALIGDQIRAKAISARDAGSGLGDVLAEARKSHNRGYECEIWLHLREICRQTHGEAGEVQFDEAVTDYWPDLGAPPVPRLGHNGAYIVPQEILQIIRAEVENAFANKPISLRAMKEVRDNSDEISHLKKEIAEIGATHNRIAAAFGASKSALTNRGSKSDRESDELDGDRTRPPPRKTGP